MKLKIILGLVAITCMIILSTIVINGLKAELPDNGDINEHFTEVIQVGECYNLNCYPGTVSGNCVVISQYHNSSDPLLKYNLYIDGEFHSIGKSIKTISINDQFYAGYLFEKWNTTLNENGIHELQIFNENEELVLNILVFVKKLKLLIFSFLIT